MKKIIQIMTMIALAALTADGADKKQTGGPKGGRLLEKTEPKAEFVLEKDRTGTLNFYDANLKPVAASEQKATLIADTKTGKQQIEFEKKGDALITTGKLPEGDGYNVVVQLKEKADGKAQNHRFKLDTHTCGGCQRSEYACICDH